MKDPMKFLQAAMERLALKASGIPWSGRKTPGPYMAYFPQIKGGIATLRSGRRYQATDGGWRVMNKPTSRRAQHRLRVARKKAGRG